MMPEKVSVITPLHNSSSFISATINSVIAQTYSNWEMIIVDDCSTDRGVEIVKAFQKKEDRIKLIHNKTNSGPAISRNKAIEAASGRFIAFLDSDDRWTPDKLEKQLNFMREHQYEFTFTSYKLVDEEQHEIGIKDNFPSIIDYNKLLSSNYIGCLTAVYDTNNLGKVFMPNIWKRQDYGLWLAILKKIHYAYCLQEPLAYYTVRRSSVSSNKFNLLKYNWQLFREVENLPMIKAAYYLIKNIINKIKG